MVEIVAPALQPSLVSLLVERRSFDGARVLDVDAVLIFRSAAANLDVAFDVVFAPACDYLYFLGLAHVDGLPQILNLVEALLGIAAEVLI